MVRLYVICGSHACRTAMLALAHKGVEHRTVVLPTGLHPLAARLRGFPGNARPIRSVDGHSNSSLAAMDRLGTVPALDYEGTRVQTNIAINRFLEELRPEPALYPADPEQRAAVQEAELWADQELQMNARRMVMAAATSSGGLANLHRGGSAGRLGPLLSPHTLARRALGAFASRTAFKATGHDEELLTALEPILDRVDALLAAGTIGGETPNAADFAIVPSLALLDYRLDLRAGLRERPSFALLERMLPEPA